MANSRVIAQPTPEIRLACDRIDDAVGRLIESVNRAVKKYGAWGTYEADREAVRLLFIVIRATEGLLELARHDLVLSAPAAMIARGAFEIALKAVWLVDCDDPFEREKRWLQHVRLEEDAWKKSAAHSRRAGNSDRWALSRMDALREWREKIEAVFPSGYGELRGQPPKLPEMIATLHDPQTYIAYIYLSQFVHGGRIAANLFDQREHPHAPRGFDDASPGDWVIPMRTCWVSLFGAGRKIIMRLGADPDSFMSEGEAVEVRNTLLLAAGGAEDLTAP